MPVSKKPRKKRSTAKTTTTSSTPPALPDRRAMESFMAQLSGRKLDSTLAQAQDVMYEAFEAPTRKRRVALAKKALGISPLCADAYVMLAEEAATSIEECRGFYAKGVEAGELALGKRAFVDDVGYFWGLLETRPYMRARAGLAQALWALERRDEAIAHYQDMLRHNPNDNQGIRYLLAACLLEVGDDDALEALLDAYDEDGTAEWAYSKALLAYRKAGDTGETRKLLSEAWDANSHVPAYLIGKKKLPKTLPDYISIGGDDEAVSFAHHAGPAWRQTEGAIGWLEQTVAQLPRPEATRH